MKKIFLGIALLATITCSVAAQSVAPFKEGDRIVFLGNSITDGGHYHSYIWLYYMTRFPNLNFKILNAGIGGDKASDMYKRLDADVFSKKPTKLIVTFGMNDSGYFEYNGNDGEAFGNTKYEECHAAFKLMEQRFTPLATTNIVMLGSTPYDETAKIADNQPFKGKNAVMKRIVVFQEESAQRDGWEFLDLNSSMTQLNELNQQKDPSFTLCGNDRIHPDNDGHMVMAYLFLEAQGFKGAEVAKVELDARNKKSTSSNSTISNEKYSSSQLSFNYLAHALPYPLDTIARGWGQKQSQAQATRVVPFMEEMNTEELKVKGLSNGNYKLTIDNSEIGIWNNTDLEKGINLAAITTTPQYQQALKIMYLNEERWEIERRFRDYAWIQFCFFQEKGLLFANDRKSIEVMDKEVPNNGWLAAKRDLYAKMIYPEVREMWETQIELLTSKIYEINKPQQRLVTLTKVN